MRNKLLLCLLSLALFIAGRRIGIPLLVAFVPLLMMSGSYDASWRSFWRVCGLVAIVFFLWDIAGSFDNLLAVAIRTAARTVVFMFYHYISKRARRAVANTVFVCGWVAAESLCGAYSGVFAYLLLVLITNVVVFYAVEKRTRGWITGAIATALVTLAVVVATYRSEYAVAANHALVSLCMFTFALGLCYFVAYRIRRKDHLVD